VKTRNTFTDINCITPDNLLNIKFADGSVSVNMWNKYFVYWIEKDPRVFDYLKNKVGLKIKNNPKYKHYFENTETENKDKILEFTLRVPRKSGSMLDFNWGFRYNTEDEYKRFRLDLNKYVKDNYTFGSLNRLNGFILMKYIVFYIKDKLKLNVEMSKYSEDTYENYDDSYTLSFQATKNQVLELVKNLPKNFEQDTVDKFCDDYLSKNHNIDDLSYIFRNKKKYLFSDKIKNKYDYLFNANNFDLI
jgi:hypothetical protein